MKILRINMTTLRMIYERIPPKYKGWGGRGLVAKIMTDEVPPTCDPLGSLNKLILTSGPLSGTLVSGADRLSIGGKSPLTRGIKESNSGGIIAQRLTKLGIKAIIIEGKPKQNKVYILKIGEEKVDFLPAERFVLMSNYTFVKEMQSVYGENIGVVSNGPAGMLKLPAAGIALTDKDGSPGRFAARGGLAAVMGSKGIKGLIVEGSGTYSVKAKNKDVFKKARRIYSDALLNNPVTGKLYPKYGTAAMVMAVNESGALPTRNFSSGKFKDAKKISGDALHTLIQSRAGCGKTTHSCMPGCIVRCSNIIPDKEGKFLVSPLEYETIAMLGSNLGIGDLDEIAYLNYLCNDIGVDTIEIGGAIGVAMESDIFNFGDFNRVVDILHQIGKGSIPGRVIGSGVAITGRVLGSQRIPAVKGQGIPAYDPRAVKGMGVTYATSPMGADHTAGYTAHMKMDHHKAKGQIEASRQAQIIRTSCDALGICSLHLSAFGDKPELLTDLLNAVYGSSLSPNYIYKLGKDVLRMEKIFNREAGFSNIDDRLPDYFTREPLPPFDLVFDIQDKKIDKIFNF